MSALTPLRIVRRPPASVGPHDWPSRTHALLQRLYAARGVACPDEAGHRLAGLLPPDALGGLERATQLLADAVASDSRIVIAGDYDCDGATGCAVGVRGLRMLGARNVGYVVPDRHKDLYRDAIFPKTPNMMTPAEVARHKPAWAECFSPWSRRIRGPGR